MQRSSLWKHTFPSPACVHAIESSDDGSRRSTMPSNNEEPLRKRMNKKVMKLLLLPLKHRQRIPKVLRSLSWGAKKEDPSQNRKADGVVREREESDADTFVSANSSELRSFSTGVDVGDSETPFWLSPPPIFPTGSIERPPPLASPMKIVRKLPFGYVIGRQLDLDTPTPSPPPSMTTLSREIKTAMPLMAWLHLQSRSRMVKKKVSHAFKEVCQRGVREGVEETGSCGNDDQDVFWKKDVKGLRCRRVQDDDAPY